MFKISNVVWGSDTIIPGEPEICRFNDVVYRPFSTDVYFTEYAEWGITDRDGYLLPETAYTRGENDDRVGQTQQQPDIRPDRLTAAPEKTYVYGGPLIPHYGHFLLTSLSRLWAADHDDLRRHKILFHSDYDVVQMMRIPYIDALLKATGIDPNRFVSFHANTLIDTLIVPMPAFVEQKQGNTLFRDHLLMIGQNLRAGEVGPASDRPLYISKTQLTGGVSRCTNEWVVEDILRRQGIEIVYPEQLSLREQLNLFGSHRTIVGSSTSAFHSLAMLEQPPSLLSVSSKNLINSNFLILDKLSDIRGAYVFDDDCRGADQETFIESYALANPIAHAKSILDWIDIEQSGKGSIWAPHQLGHLSPNVFPDLAGPPADAVMTTLHERRRPRAYLEAGVFQRPALHVAACPAVAIGQHPVIDASALARTPLALIVREESEQFFAAQPALRQLLGQPVELALLNGAHSSERLLRDFAYVERHSSPDGLIVLHDCIPVELAMTDLTGHVPLALPHRAGWWIGDNWRALLALKEFRPDLDIAVVDASPAGLALVRRLDPASSIILDDWEVILERMNAYDLQAITIAGFRGTVGLHRTDDALADIVGDVKGSQ